MNIQSIIEHEMQKSEGTVKIIKVPSHLKPTTGSLKKLDHEISAQVKANEAMQHRSMINALKI